MAVNRCPSCASQVIPGEVTCRRCGFDFILGRKPEDWNPIDEARRRKTMLVSGLAGALLVAGIILVLVVGGGPDEDVRVADPCLDALVQMQPIVAAAVDRGNPVPKCEATPPGDPDCWTAVGVTIPTFAAEGLSFTLRAGGTVFELKCLIDADGDGVAAVYKANAVIDGVKISGSDIK
jgi:hypothetical protein